MLEQFLRDSSSAENDKAIAGFAPAVALKRMIT